MAFRRDVEVRLYTDSKDGRVFDQVAPFDAGEDVEKHLPDSWGVRKKDEIPWRRGEATGVARVVDVSDGIDRSYGLITRRCILRKVS